MFVSVQYHATVPVVSQPVMLGPIPSFSQSSGLPRVPMLANVLVAATTPKCIAQEDVRRQLPVYWGAYVYGFVQAIDATLTIDTGACDMIVSLWLFENMSKDQRPQLLKVQPWGSAGGEPLKSYGKAIMEIWMGPLCFNHMCIVADILDQVLLGEDPLLCNSSGSADIILSEEKRCLEGPLYCWRW